MLELRAPDLPRLHDADAGRHALPGVRAPDDAGAHDARRCTATPIATYVLIAINVLMFVALSARRHATALDWLDASSTSARRARRRRRATTGGSSPAASCTPGTRCTSASTCTSLYCLGQHARAGARARCASSRIYFASLLAGSFGASCSRARTAHGRRVGRGLRPDGRGVVMPARARRSTRCSRGSAPMILLNLVFTFLFPGQLSIGGHLGGLVGGVARGLRSITPRGRAPAAGRCCRCSPASAIAADRRSRRATRRPPRSSGSARLT